MIVLHIRAIEVSVCEWMLYFTHGEVHTQVVSIYINSIPAMVLWQNFRNMIHTFNTFQRKVRDF